MNMNGKRNTVGVLSRVLAVQLKKVLVRGGLAWVKKVA